MVDSSGRNKIVYELTESGKKALQLADKFEVELKLTFGLIRFSTGIE